MGDNTFACKNIEAWVTDPNRRRRRTANCSSSTNEPAFVLEEYCCWRVEGGRVSISVPARDRPGLTAASKVYDASVGGNSRHDNKVQENLFLQIEQLRK